MNGKRPLNQASVSFALVFAHVGSFRAQLFRFFVLLLLVVVTFSVVSISQVIG